MRESDFKSKVKVFISSNINEKLKIVREALNVLLLQTCMCSTYCFEEEPGTSTNVIDTYLYQIERSDLIVFLIDNAEEIGEGTLKEVKRSRELNKKCIFLFCDENSKEETELQKEIRCSNGEKFKVVSKMSHLAEEAYYCVLSDIVDIYLKYCGNHLHYLDSIQNGVVESQEVNINESQTIVKKDTKYEYLKSILIDYALYESDFSGECSEMEHEMGELLLLILGKSSLERINYNLLKKCLLDTFSGGNLKKIVQNRLDAYERYCKGQIEEAISCLLKAIEIAQNAKNIPLWVLNDIAIDLRNLSNELDNQNNIFNINNRGQTILDASVEPIYYPVVDRSTSDFYKHTFEDSLQNLFVSPFTINLGGIGKSVIYLIDIFSSALLYGSITHIELVREKLANYLEYLSMNTRNHKHFSAAVQMLLIIGDEKKLEKYLQRYGEYTDSINENDVMNWKNSIETIGIKYKRLHSEMLLLTHFGYYFSDDEFESYYENVKAHFRVWMDEQFAGDLIAKAYITMLKKISHRVNSKELINTAYLFTNNRLTRWYRELFSILDAVNISELKCKETKKYSTWLIERCYEDEGVINGQYLMNAVQAFRFQIDVADELDKTVKEVFFDFYKSTYSLNVFNHNTDDVEKYIQKQIEAIHIRNENQGQNGCYSCYSYDPFKTIYNIIVNGNTESISSVCIKRICEIVLETLFQDKQTYEDKCSATLLLSFLFLSFKNNTDIMKAINDINTNIDTCLLGTDLLFAKGYTERLYKSILTYLDLLTNSYSEIQFVKFFSQLPSLEESELIIFLKGINDLSLGFNDVIANTKGIFSFLHFLLETSRSNNKTIRCLSFICMLNVIRFNEEFKPIVLECASQAMDLETADVKIAIVSRVVEMDKTDTLVNYIIAKGKVDNNYWVRLVSNR